MYGGTECSLQFLQELATYAYLGTDECSQSPVILIVEE